MGKILVTGAAGFIGSHLCELLVRSGFRVVAFDRYNTDNTCGWLEESSILDDIEVILGDARDYDSIFKSMEGCFAVFHLAALIGVPYSYVSPLAYIRTNVEGTYNVLEAAKNREISNVIITSTSETYGTAQYCPIDENHPLVGQSPYAASKIAADQLAISYHRSYGLPVKIIRPFNIYGPRQSTRAVIPTIIFQGLGGANEIKLGRLTPTRDLTFVGDACHAFLEIFSSASFFGEIVNVGMNNEISVGKLAKKIMTLMSLDIPIVEDKNRFRPDTSEVQRLRCNNKKIVEGSCWSATTDLGEGLKETIDWFRPRCLSKKSYIYSV